MDLLRNVQPGPGHCGIESQSQVCSGFDQPHLPAAHVQIHGQAQRSLRGGLGSIPVCL